MKIKFKVRPNQYAEFVNSVGILAIKATKLNNISPVHLINLQYFYFDGTQKVNRMRLHKQMFSEKIKTFSIDINHYETIKSILQTPDLMVGDYLKAIYLTIKHEAESIILNEVSRLKMLNR